MCAVIDNNAPRLFVAADLPGPIAFDQGQANYLRNVMRLSPGATVKVFNGRDGEFAARIEALGKRGGSATWEGALSPGARARPVSAPPASARNGPALSMIAVAITPACPAKRNAAQPAHSF